MSTNPMDLITELVDRFVCARGESGILISTAEAIKAIRASASGHFLSDEELARLVASHAISRGYSVAFDAEKVPSPGAPAPE